MISLVAAIISSLGGATLGAFLKIVGNVISGWMDARSLAAREKLVMVIKHGDTWKDVDKDLVRTLMGEAHSTWMRDFAQSLVAIVSIVGIAAIGWHSIQNPEVSLLTILHADEREHVSMLWGLFKFPQHGDSAHEITLGHVGITALGMLSGVLGYFFFPSGGRK